MEKLRNYILGFALSVVLTLAAFILAMKHLLTGDNFILTILGLAVIQLWVQLIFFMHLDNEKGSRWNLAIFLSTISLIIIIVAGSIWIMNHLNYNMTPDQINQYINNQGAF